MDGFGGQHLGSIKQSEEEQRAHGNGQLGDAQLSRASGFATCGITSLPRAGQNSRALGSYIQLRKKERNGLRAQRPRSGLGEPKGRTRCQIWGPGHRTEGKRSWRRQKGRPHGSWLGLHVTRLLCHSPLLSPPRQSMFLQNSRSCVKQKSKNQFSQATLYNVQAFRSKILSLTQVLFGSSIPQKM